LTLFPPQGKWKTIKAVSERSSADWIVLVDAGTLWDETFLTEAFRRVGRTPGAIAFAPTYRPMNAGWIHRALWRLETALKSMENGCGGPVSLHGATVGYRSDLIKKTLARLGEDSWLNDDVVIPLVMRSIHPDGVILYPVGTIRDAGVKEKPDLARRRRMLLGNAQWIRALLPDCLRQNPVAGMLAFRRLFRVFWAYWFVFTAVGLAFSFRFAVIPAAAVLCLLMTASPAFRQLAGAAWVSLTAPWALLRTNAAARSDWK
jgi:hypothetical protein